MSKESESNGMNAYNLARVFCPSLMRNTADQVRNIFQIIFAGNSKSFWREIQTFDFEQGSMDNFTSRDRADIDHQTRVVELLILHATAIFGPAESVLPKDYSLRYSANRTME